MASLSISRVHPLLVAAALVVGLALGCGGPVPGTAEAESAGFSSPVAQIEGDDDDGSDGERNLTMVEFELCCDQGGCHWDREEDSCDCTATLLGAVEVAACVMGEALDSTAAPYDPKRYPIKYPTPIRFR